MNNYSDLKYFTEFQQKSCTEIIEKYNKNQADISGSSIDEIIFNYFMPTYSCILRNDVDNAKTWKDNMEYALKGKDISLSQNSQYDIVTNFLDAHISRLKFEFYEALNHISAGYNEAKNTNNIHFCIRFMFLRGWLYSYLGHSELAEAEFLEAEKVIKENHIDKESDPFAVDIISAARCFIKNEEENESWNKWAKFFYYEMLVNDGRMKLDLVDTVTSVQGRYSYLDRIEQLIINKITDRDTEWQELYGKLYPNQKLYCELLTNKELTLNDINFDTLILFGKQLDKYVMENKISGLQKKSLLETFDKFIRNLNFQADFKNYESFVRLWLSERKGTYSEYLKYCGSNNVYSSFIEKDLKIEADYALSKCVSNIELILNINDGNGSRFLSPEEELNLRVFIYQYVKDDDNANKIAALLNDIDLNDEINSSRESFFKEYDALNSNRVCNSLINNIAIKSVIANKYVNNNHDQIERFLSALGETCIDFKDLELELLENQLTLDIQSEELQTDSVGAWDIVKDKKDGYDIWHIEKSINDKTVKKDLFIFDKKGVWDCMCFESPFRDWKKDGDNKTIPSPLSKLNKNMSLTENVECIFVLLSGVVIKDRKEFYEAFPQDDFIVISLKELTKYISSSECLYIPKKDSDGHDVRFNYIPEDIENNEVITDYYQMLTKIRDGKKLKQNQYKRFHTVLFLEELIDKLVKINEIQKATWNVKYELRINSLSFVFLIEDKICIENNEIKHEHVVKEYTSKPDISTSANKEEIFNVESDSKRCNLTFCIDEIFLHKIDLFSEKDCKKLAIEKEDVYEIYERCKGNNYFTLSLSEFGNLLRKQNEPFANRTAKVAIITRNISHNLGSHVMAYLKHYLSSVSEMIRNNVLGQMFNNEKDIELLIKDPNCWMVEKKRQLKKQGQALNDVSDIALPFLVGLGKFISYMQERQDLIATIAMNYQSPCFTINFKDLIYDELNPDKRHKRHSNRRGLKPANILLGNIARSEGIGRDVFGDASLDCKDSDYKQDNDIVIKFRDFDGNPVEENTKESTSLDEMRTYNFSVPAGVIGRHAIFSILENVIRNAAKHGKRDKNSSLELTFDIYDHSSIENAPKDDNVDGELSLQDVLSKFYKDAKDGDQLYYVTLTDNLDTDYETLKTIRKALVDPYIEESGNMKDKYKGFKEMRIFSAWLRSLEEGEEYCPIPTYKIKDKTEYDTDKPDKDWEENTSNPAPALYIRLSNKHLQFIFCVKKPMDVLLISDKFSDDNYKSIIKDKLVPNAWNGITSRDFVSDSGIGSRDYYCILLEDENKYDDIRCKSNSRLLCLKDIPELGEDFIEKISEITLEKMDEIYTTLLRELSGYVEGEKIVVRDDRAKHDGNEKLNSLLEVSLRAKYNKYMYVSHYDSKSAFEDFKRHCNTTNLDYEFIESITGNNSTDRLVRCEPIDENWFYKHLRAMKTKVAIIDERLSDKLYRISKNDIADLSKVDVRQYCQDINGSLYADKKIFLFDVVRSVENKFILYGWMSKREDFEDGKYNGYCDRLAVIEKSDETNSFKIELTDVGRNFFKENRFDKLSIHQGLMDKFYDIFRIKNNDDDKEILMKSLYELFCDGNVIKIKGKGENIHYFLPGMSVHSGRSRPPKNDMPQRLPFIPYASIEHAVLDCKFTLIELLDYAYYESLYNND